MNILINLFLNHIWLIYASHIFLWAIFFIFGDDDDTCQSWDLVCFWEAALWYFYIFFFLDRISLITKDEAEGSSVTSEEAEKVS